MIQVPSYFTQLGMIVVALTSTFFWNRLDKSRWRIAAFGALGWIVTVALKFAWKTPTNSYFEEWLSGELLGDTPYLIYRGFLTGLFECLLLYFILVRTHLKKLNWTEAIAFGVGFGAVEAFGLGIFLLVRTFSPNAFVDLTYPLYIFAIRLAVTIVHVFTCVLVLYAVSMKQLSWLFLSFLFKSTFDAVGAIILFGRFLEEPTQSTLVFLWCMISALISLVGLWYLRRNYNSSSLAGEIVQVTAAS